MRKKFEIINLILFIIYVTCLLYLTLAKNFIGRTNGVYGINLVPFVSIINIFKSFIYKEVSTAFFIRNIIGNFILFMPFAYFIPTVFKNINHAKYILILFFSIIIIEILQYATQIGFCDIDDLILNFSGGIIAYIVYNLTILKKSIQL